VRFMLEHMFVTILLSRITSVHSPKYTLERTLERKLERIRDSATYLCVQSVCWNRVHSLGAVEAIAGLS
jgi:hypothetical protein